jgi:hypothetical protein
MLCKGHPLLAKRKNQTLQNKTGTVLHNDSESDWFRGPVFFFCRHVSRMALSDCFILRGKYYNRLKLAEVGFMVPEKKNPGRGEFVRGPLNPTAAV